MYTGQRVAGLASIVLSGTRASAPAVRDAPTRATRAARPGAAAVEEAAPPDMDERADRESHIAAADATRAIPPVLADRICGTEPATTLPPVARTGRESLA